VLGAGISDRLALPHQRGALAMARSQDPNSASAQFYIALNDLPELDGRYAVFGRVIEGMDVVDQIRQGDKLIKAEIIQP
jgi:peptidyl-prolyl cis-trans isomerase B (cyclophilin B)